MQFYKHRQQGFTLPEILFASVVAIIVLLAVGSLTQSGSFAMEHLSRAQQVDFELKRAMDRLTEVIKAAPTSAVTIDESNADHDVLTLQISNPQTPLVTDLGYFDEDNDFQSGYTIEFRVVNGELVMQNVDDSGTVVATHLLCREIDNAINDGGIIKGFEVTVNSPFVNFLIRVRTEFTPGKEMTRVEQTQVYQTNQ